MKEFFKKIITKFLCSHQWEEFDNIKNDSNFIQEIKEAGGSIKMRGFIPSNLFNNGMIILVCGKCGKIKTIRY
jgi:hypothetical protein